VTDDIVALLIREIPSLRDDERVVSLLCASVSANVATLLHMFEHGIDPGFVDAPAEAIAYARRLAQRGVPIVALVRAYRIGHARFLHWCSDELMEVAADGPLAGAGEATRRMLELSFAYIDRTSEQVVRVYGQERDLWADNSATVRITRVRALLSADDVDVDSTELSLGYRLRQRHVGLVAWVDEPGRDGEGLVVLERVARALAERAGCVGTPLFVPCDESAAWVWLPIGSGRGEPSERFRMPLDIAQPNVRVCSGEPAAGVEGFRRTHREALRAQTVALAAGPSCRRFTAYADIRPIALMSSDLGATRAWVHDTLGCLTIDDDHHARLRETLHVFLSTGGSYTSAGDRLTVHKNTVHYRVQKAEEMRGRPVREDRLEVELALLACGWLGPAVLDRAGE
jgi:hypothetical protein